MVIGANLPDLDVLAYFAGPEADLEWRRGWSHGILALVVLPFVLAGSLLLVHRAGRRLRSPDARSAAPGQLLLLSFIAILSHPILDTLNTYGMRWLMPFSARWFYGDTLFIIDPWMWLALALGVYYGRRRENAARIAFAAVALYTASMALSGHVARAIITREVASVSGKPVLTTMAGPAPVDPLERHFVVEQEEGYRVGRFRWFDRPHVDRSEVLTFPRGRPTHPAFDAAVATLRARRFLGWARFPTFAIESVSAGGYLVHFIDLRYARSPDDSFGALSIPVTLTSTFGISH